MTTVCRFKVLAHNCLVSWTASAVGNLGPKFWAFTWTPRHLQPAQSHILSKRPSGPAMKRKVVNDFQVQKIPVPKRITGRFWGFRDHLRRKILGSPPVTLVPPSFTRVQDAWSRACSPLRTMISEWVFPSLNIISTHQVKTTSNTPVKSPSHENFVPEL